MDNLVDPTPRYSLLRARSCDLGQQPLPDSTETDPGTPFPPKSPKPRVQHEMLSASNFALWTCASFPVASYPSVSTDPETSGVFLSDEETRFIRQIREDLSELPPNVHDSSAAQLCARFAEGVGLALARYPATRLAVFADDDAVTMVAHSPSNKRQLSFEFRPDGFTIGIITIDQDMERSERECRIEHARTIETVIAWLVHR